MGQKITPVSLRLKKSNIKTPRGSKILERAEKQLLDERVRSINNTIDICTNLRDTCIKDLKELNISETYEDCHEFIKKIRECRHKTIPERHIKKFNQLCQQNKGGHSNHTSGHSNQHTSTKTHEHVPIPKTATTTATTTTSRQKWVKNLSGVPLTKAQASLLTHGPNFAMAPRHPHGEYIVAVQQVCLILEPHNAVELRAEIRGTLKHSHPQEEHQQGRSPGPCRIKKRPVKGHPNS